MSFTPATSCLVGSGKFKPCSIVRPLWALATATVESCSLVLDRVGSISLRLLAMSTSPLLVGALRAGSSWRHQVASSRAGVSVERRARRCGSSARPPPVHLDCPGTSAEAGETVTCGL